MPDLKGHSWYDLNPRKCKLCGITEHNHKKHEKCEGKETGMRVYPQDFQCHSCTHTERSQLRMMQHMKDEHG